MDMNKSIGQIIGFKPIRTLPNKIIGEYIKTDKYSMNEQSEPILIYEDDLGNKIYKKFIKTRKIWQFYAKNAQGQLIKASGFNYLVRKAGLMIGPSTKPGIEKFKNIRKNIRRL